MIQSLQSLRFVFAIMIFLHHASLFEAGGSCGVSFFMILSGFVMSVGYETKVQTASFSYKNFIAKRLIRVYPLHLLCLLGFIIFHFFYYLREDGSSCYPICYCYKAGFRKEVTIFQGMPYPGVFPVCCFSISLFLF